MLGREVGLAGGVPVHPTGVRHGEGQDSVQQKNISLSTGFCARTVAGRMEAHQRLKHRYSYLN